MHNLVFLPLAFMLATVPAIGQEMVKGRVHLGVGMDLGAHATQYQQTVRLLGIPFGADNSGSAATVLFPIRVQYGLTRHWSSGLYFSAGSYIDSSATRTNGIALIGLCQDFHIVEGERFSWTASVSFGGTRLVIEDKDALGAFQSRFGGPHVGVGTGVRLFFTRNVGLRMDLGYFGSALTLNEHQRNGRAVDPNLFDASLNTSGITLHAGLALRL